jgi:hypothetical protein
MDPSCGQTQGEDIQKQPMDIQLTARRHRRYNSTIVGGAATLSRERMRDSRPRLSTCGVGIGNVGQPPPAVDL